MILTDPISKWISYGEAIRSDTASRLGIPNIPNEEQLAAMKYVATEIFDKVREHFGPLHVNSFLRVPELNNSTPGASKTSSHMKGEAIDMSLLGRNVEVFKYIKENIDTLDADQIIWEFGNKAEPAWVHVSKRANQKNRREILRAYHDQDNNARYVPFDLF
jgi:zinc D-Ala-D-Ala carboxypeptidase